MSAEHMSIIPALKRLRMKDYYLEANLGYTVRPCLKNQKQKSIYKHWYAKKTCWEKKIGKVIVSQSTMEANVNILTSTVKLY